jgi:hypothetical protein
VKFINKKKKADELVESKKNLTPHSTNPVIFFMKMTRITASLKSKRFKHNINRKTYSFTVKFHYSNSTTIRSNTFVDYPTIEAAMRDCQRFEDLLQNEGKIRGFKPIVLRQTEPVIQRDDEAPIAGMFLQFQAQFYNNIVIMSLFYILSRHIS